MSKIRTREWLLAQRKNVLFRAVQAKRLTSGKAKTISFTGGKGGVGKTSAAVKFSSILGDLGYKVLLIDCDYNLSNTSIKLGLPIQNEKFTKLVNGKIQTGECIFSCDSFDLLPACNGSLDFLDDSDFCLDKVVINVLVEKENDYDFILLDCPAGLQREALTLNAYSDYRFMVVTPDRSSITDAYSLIKILNYKYGVNENHLLFNKISNDKQYRRLSKSLQGTVDQFLSCRLKNLGHISFDNTTSECFDQRLLKDSASEIHKNFIKVVVDFTDKYISSELKREKFMADFSHCASGQFEQEVQL